jgi:hypothetical protein
MKGKQLQELGFAAEKWKFHVAIITRGDNFMAPVDGCHFTTLYPLVV